MSVLIYLIYLNISIIAIFLYWLYMLQYYNVGSGRREITLILNINFI